MGLVLLLRGTELTQCAQVGGPSRALCPAGGSERGYGILVPALRLLARPFGYNEAKRASQGFGRPAWPSLCYDLIDLNDRNRFREPKQDLAIATAACGTKLE